MSIKPALPFGTDLYTRILLTLIAVFLGIVALRPIVRPTPVEAQADSPRVYIEPGTTTLRNPDGTQQVEGKVMIDLRTGEIWGFPTLSPYGYPVDVAHSAPPVSAPMYLGRFDFSKMGH